MVVCDGIPPCDVRNARTRVVVNVCVCVCGDCRDGVGCCYDDGGCGSNDCRGGGCSSKIVVAMEVMAVMTVLVVVVVVRGTCWCMPNHWPFCDILVTMKLDDSRNRSAQFFRHCSVLCHDVGGCGEWWLRWGEWVGCYFSS